LSEVRLLNFLRQAQTLYSNWFNGLMEVPGNLSSRCGRRVGQKKLETFWWHKNVAETRAPLQFSKDECEDLFAVSAYATVHVNLQWWLHGILHKDDAHKPRNSSAIFTFSHVKITWNLESLLVWKKRCAHFRSAFASTSTS
jgi:hypothetical protein